MSQEALAFNAGMSVSRLRDIEHGAANPSIDILESIALVFGVTLPVLFLFSMTDGEILSLVYAARRRMEELQAVSV